MNTYTTPGGQSVTLLNRRMFVEMDPLPDTTSSGIYVGETGKPTNRTGTVRAVGFVTTPNGRVPIPGVAVGDRVTFIRYAAVTHTNEKVQELFGEDYLFLDPKDILLVETPEEGSHSS